MLYLNYLRSHRRRWLLSQEELAFLLDSVSSGALSRYELGQQTPRAEVLLGCEIIFGTPARELFPGMYNDLQERIMRRAAKLDQGLGDDTDATAVIKRALFREMAQRPPSPTDEEV